MTFRFPLATSTWDKSEISALNRVIASDQYTMGGEVAEFEKQFAKYFGSRFALMTNSGSSTNLLMTAALRFSNNPKIRLEPGLKSSYLL